MLKYAILSNTKYSGILNNAKMCNTKQTKIVIFAT